jgi:hypothetical protein
MPAIFRAQLWRHGLQLSGEQQVQEQRFKNVVTVMAQSNLCHSQFRGDAVEMTAAKA